MRISKKLLTGAAMIISLLFIVALVCCVAPRPPPVPTGGIGAERPFNGTESRDVAEYAMSILAEHGYSYLSANVTEASHSHHTGGVGEDGRPMKDWSEYGYVIDCYLGGGEHHMAEVVLVWRNYTDGSSTIQATKGVMDGRYDFINNTILDNPRTSIVAHRDNMTGFHTQT